MKLVRSITCLAISLFGSTFAFAEGSLNPGWYIGVIGGFGGMGSLHFPPVPVPFLTMQEQNNLTGNSKFGLLGNAGFQVGYRYCNFRFEGEFLFGGGKVKNINGFRSETDYPLVDPTFNFRLRRLFFAGFANLIYDFYSYKREVRFVPYAGLGIGAIRVQDQFILNRDTVQPFIRAGEFKTSYSAPLAQAIVGVTFLLDDFSNLGFDFRYMTSNPVSQLADDRIKIYTLNLVFNYTLDDF